MPLLAAISRDIMVRPNHPWEIQMSGPQLTVRAIDVGYGYVKYTDGRAEESASIHTDSFPSQSPPPSDQITDTGVMHRRDTFVVGINDRKYEVGKAIALAVHGNQEIEVLDREFALSDPYAARLYGALNYMAPSLPDNCIDHLVLGLPLTTYSKCRAALAQRFCGEHVINLCGDTIRIRTCHVYPQPLGGYVSYLAMRKRAFGQPIPTALVLDPGYNTVDWFVCKGMQASEIRSAAVERGVCVVLRAVAEHIIKAADINAGVTEIARCLDQALTQGAQLTICGKPKNLNELMVAGERVIEEAAQAVKNAIGFGADIDVIVMTGGGARLYAQAVAKRFPEHEVVILDDPAHANVRGFHLMGEQLACSAARSIGPTTKPKTR
jgi:plasmid segregation protein ParM